MNKAKQIRDFQKANPTYTPQAIADECGVKRAYVYQVLHGAKKKVKKVKPVATESKSSPTQGQQVLREEIDRLHALIANMKILEELSDQTILEYENDIIGYRAVISYLQGQIDGVTV